jgi:hypothetical protein
MAVLLILALVLPSGAQDVPSVTVGNQAVLNDTVTVVSAYSEGPGFMVIHMDSNGSFGPVIGHRALFPGWNFNIQVPIDATQATPVLYAMLHSDTGAVGVYEFGSVEGADGPVAVDGNVVSPAFNVDVISANDQFVSNGTVTVASVVAQADGWLAMHSDNEGRPGPVLGTAAVTAGANANVVVTLDGAATNVLWPMLHLDTGTVGTYEFGTVEGADGPVVVNGVVAVTPFWTVPHMRIADQIALGGDGMDLGGMTPHVVAASVLAEVDGFLVIHQEADGGPGPVAGFAPVTAGLNTNVNVDLDPAMVTANLWPMLHVDTGTAGTYEFGTVEGADGPVRVNDAVLTFPINAAPDLVVESQTVSPAAMGMGPYISIKTALIDAPGWLAIHSGAEGRPGPVIGYAQLHPGLNSNVLVEVDEAQAGTQVFPMLHYDTGEAGVYEFGTVEGADGPVRVGESVIVVPMGLGEGAGDPAATEESGG